MAIADLVLKVIGQLPHGSYRVQAVLVVDGKNAKEFNRTTAWHQDVFNNNIKLVTIENVESLPAKYRYLWFCEIDRQGFGNSPMLIGKTYNNLVSHREAYRSTEAPDDAVELLKSIAPRPGARYFIDQNYIDDEGFLIVHRSPLLKKEDPSAARMKLILRIIPVSFELEF